MNIRNVLHCNSHCAEISLNLRLLEHQIGHFRHHGQFGIFSVQHAAEREFHLKTDSIPLEDDCTIASITSQVSAQKFYPACGNLLTFRLPAFLPCPGLV